MIFFLCIYVAFVVLLQYGGNDFSKHLSDQMVEVKGWATGESSPSPELVPPVESMPPQSLEAPAPSVSTLPEATPPSQESGSSPSAVETPPPTDSSTNAAPEAATPSPASS